MTKDYKLGNAIPELTVPVTDKSGRMTRQWREYFERDRVQQGGQGGDANYEALIIQTDDQSVILELKEQIGEAVAQQRSDFEAVLEQTQTLAEELRQQRDDALAQASVLAEEVKGLLARLDELSVIREVSATEDALAQVSQRVDDLAIGLEAAQSEQEPSGALEGRLQSLEQQLQEQAVSIQSIQGGSLDADFLNADIINAATSVGSPQANFTNATVGTLTLTNPLAVAQGGTGATTASGARTNIGLGSISTQDNTSVNIDGGNIDGTVIGASATAAGSFTSCAVNGSSVVASYNSSNNFYLFSLGYAGTVGGYIGSNGSALLLADGTVGTSVSVKINTVNISSLPTSSAGLLTGDLWNDSGTVKVA